MSRDRVRVLQVLGRSAGGVGGHVALVTAALDGEDFAIDVASPEETIVAMPKPVIPLEVPRGALGHGKTVRALTEIVRGGYDVVHAHGLRAGIDAARAARRAGAPAIVTVHNLVLPDISGRTKAFFYRWAEPLVVRLSTRTFAVSEEMARHLRKVARVGEERVEILHVNPGPAPPVKRGRDEIRAELGLEATDRLVVTASRLVPQKSLPVMFDAVVRLGEGVHLAVAGSGRHEERLKRAAAELPLGERLHWLGYRTDLPDYLAAADVFCLSSKWEAVPLAAQEAIMLGTPVVATAVGGLPELVTDRRSGRLVPKEDPAALAEALSEVLENDDLARSYVKEALEDYEERFSAERMLARLAEAYRWAAR